MSTSTQRFSPYVGPRPFERRHTKVFFGRTKEADELLSFVSANQVVLIYAQSGVGKTSLLNAGLVPLLEREEFEIFPITRVRGLIPNDIPYETVANPYVLNTLISWAPEDIAPSTLLTTTIGQFLRDHPHRKDATGFELPRVAIFDQFEELFSFYPDRWEKRQEFFEQLRDALTNDDLFRVILVMREDFLAQIDPYSDILPGRMRSRFRLEPMSLQGALAAVTNPLVGTGRSFAPGVAEQLVEELTKVRVETEEGGTRVISGEFVEPVQLQVVCQSLWQHLPADVQVIDARQLASFGNIDEALIRFYEDSLASAVKRAQADEDQLRAWFEKVLITPAGTRGTVYQGREETGGIPNQVVSLLENQHIVRAELRAGGRWYELTHDRFVEPIQKSNAAWGLEKEKEQQQAHEGELQRRLRRQLTYIGLLVLVLIAALAATAIVFQARNTAEEQKSIALTAVANATIAQGQALIQAATATNAQGEALMQAALAGTRAAQATIAQGQAVEQQNTAVAAEATAGRSADLARSQALASGASQDLANGQPELAIALALEANQVEAPPPLAYQSLFDSVTLSRVRKRLAGHLQSVNAVAFSRDGRYIVSGSSDETVMIWDAQTGTVLRTLTGHTDEVVQVAISPDSKYVISGGSNGALILWDMTTGSLIQRLAGHSNLINGISFSPDGSQFVTGDSSLVIVWNAKTVTPLVRMPFKQPYFVTGVKYSTKLGVILVAQASNSDREVTLYDVTNPFFPTVFEVHTTDYVDSMDMSSDGTKIVTGEDNGNIEVWNALNSEKIATYREHPEPVYAVAFTPNNQAIFAAGWGFPPVLWDLRTGVIIRRFEGDQTGALAAVFAPDGNTVVTGSEDSTLILWDVQTSDLLYTFQGNTTRITGVAFHPDGSRFLSGARDGTMILWDLKTHQPIQHYSGLTISVTAAFSPDGSTILSGSGSSVDLWNTENGVIIRSFAGLTDNVLTTAISPDGRYAAAAGSDKKIIVWDLQTGQMLSELTGHTSVIWSIKFSPDGQHILSGSADGTLILWDWRTRGKVWVNTGNQAELRSVDISPDGRLAASTSGDHTVVIWDMATGTPIRTLRGHSKFVDDVKFSPDGTTLLSGSDDDTMILWDVASGQPLRRFQGHAGWVLAVAYSPDGKRAISGSEDTNINLWDISPYSQGLFVWLQGNRSVAELTCEQRALYQVNVQCDANGRFPTRTPFPTLIPTMTRTPSPTVDLTRMTATPTSSLTPTRSPEALVAQALQAQHISLESGYEVVLRDTITIDLTGKDNLLDWEIIGGVYDNFAIGTTIKWGPGAPEDQCGFIFRGDFTSSSYYLLNIDRNSYLQFSPHNQGSFQHSSSLVTSQIDTDPGATNDLMLVAVGDKFSVYINGVYITQFSDSQLDRGALGALAGTYANSDVTNCTLTNTWVWNFAYTQPQLVPPTASPTPTPTAMATASAAVQNALALAHIKPSSGFLAAALDDVQLHKQRNAKNFDNSYENVVVHTVIDWTNLQRPQCGLRLRIANGARYFLLLAPNSEILFSALDSDNHESVLGQTLSTTVTATGPNDLLVVVIGNTFSVFVNGEYAAQFYDDRYHQGVFGLLSFTDADPGCSFSDSWLYNLAYATPQAMPSPTPEGTTKPASQT